MMLDTVRSIYYIYAFKIDCKAKPSIWYPKSYTFMKTANPSARNIVDYLLHFINMNKYYPNRSSVK